MTEISTLGSTMQAPEQRTWEQRERQTTSPSLKTDYFQTGSLPQEEAITTTGAVVCVCLSLLTAVMAIIWTGQLLL
jgi:hypothetical protein